MTGKNRESSHAACCGGQAVRLGHTVRDPLCGMAVDANSIHRLDVDGASHRFCSETCRDDYARILNGETVPGVEFTCVEHPEGRQDRPGPCVVCGTPLVAVRSAPTGEAAGPHGLLEFLRSALHI